MYLRYLAVDNTMAMSRDNKNGGIFVLLVSICKCIKKLALMWIITEFANFIQDNVNSSKKSIEIVLTIFQNRSILMIFLEASDRTDECR